jgi:hypothetical protein
MTHSRERTAADTSRSGRPPVSGPARLSIGGVEYNLTGSPKVIGTSDGITIDLGHLAGDGSPVLVAAPDAIWLRVLEVAAWAGRTVAERDPAVTP